MALQGHLGIVACTPLRLEGVQRLVEASRAYVLRREAGGQARRTQGRLVADEEPIKQASPIEGLAYSFLYL